jgi:glucokinase
MDESSSAIKILAIKLTLANFCNLLKYIKSKQQKTGTMTNAPQIKTGLIADIGATNARFAIATPEGISAQKILKCDDFPGLIDAARAYLEDARPEIKPAAGALAIAGPVKGDSFSMTNHPWSFSIETTRQALGFEHIHLYNDFHATAIAVPYLEDDALKHLAGPESIEHSAKGVIGPGTGLGVASVFWNGRGYTPVPGEGGHVTMPAKSQREFDIFNQLLEDKYSHISAERVCSGKGLVNLYNAIRRLDNLKSLEDLSPEQISNNAMDGKCEACMEALDLMLAFLGRIAGNLALTLGAHGGIYLAGGILPKLGSYFESSKFLYEFTSKGRFTDYMKDIPVYLVTDEFPAFRGLYIDLMQADKMSC